MEKSQEHYRILLADDHVLIRHGIRIILSRDKNLLIVGEVSNGDDLLDRLMHTEVDLLILDISMPKASGIELTEILKKSYPDLKILVLTMHKNIRFLRRAIAAGADGYLVKSDTEQEIISAIGKIRHRPNAKRVARCNHQSFFHSRKRHKHRLRIAKQTTSQQNIGFVRFGIVQMGSP